MRTYISIVSIATKALTHEKFGIGLLCITSDRSFFRYSVEKWRIISKLLPKEARSLAMSSLKSIEAQLTENPFQLKGDNHSFSESYLEYLSRYNNNLIQFSKPEYIDLDVNEILFRSLFRKYIYSDEKFTEHRAEVNVLDTFKTVFLNRAEIYANIDYTVTNSIIKDLISPVKVDLFGKNGAYVTGQTINFSKNKAYLLNDINAYIHLALSTEMADENAKCFILGEEPDKSLPENHKIWENARRSKNVEFVPIDESEKVIDYLEKKGVSPVE